MSALSKGFQRSVWAGLLLLLLAPGRAVFANNEEPETRPDSSPTETPTEMSRVTSITSSPIAAEEEEGQQNEKEKPRVVNIFDVITEKNAPDIIRELEALDQKSDEPITIRFVSPGGRADFGLAIFNTIKSLKSPVRTVCLGEASSMAGVLLVAGTPGMRQAYANCPIMLHLPSGGVLGTVDDMREAVENIETVYERILQILSDYTGYSKESLREALSKDWNLTPELALELGLIDEIIELEHEPPFAGEEKRKIPEGALGHLSSRSPG